MLGQYQSYLGEAVIIRRKPVKIRSHFSFFSAAAKDRAIAAESTAVSKIGS